MNDYLEVLEYFRDYCRRVTCKDCNYRQNNICLVQAITGGQPPCYWKGSSCDEEEEDAQKEENLEYLKDFKTFCRIENQKRYLEAREMWYQRHFGRSRKEQMKIYYSSPRKSKRKHHGDENFLWFNPNEFEGF